MKINKGDFVSRNSYNNDTIFKVIDIHDGLYILKGTDVRLIADSNYNDLKKEEKIEICDEDIIIDSEALVRGDYFYLPAKILHIDADEEYLDRCLKFYKRNGIMAIGKKITEEHISEQLTKLLVDLKPDILIITGHDSYVKRNDNINDFINYRNSKYFATAIKVARNYEKSHEKLIIIAGACQSNYEELIKAGANFASSPKRVNIHALDPAIIASTIALTKRTEEIDLIKLLNKTKYKEQGMGGLICNGLMYVGYPR